jgi:hypothetical protein
MRGAAAAAEVQQAHARQKTTSIDAKIQKVLQSKKDRKGKKAPASGSPVVSPPHPSR